MATACVIVAILVALSVGETTAIVIAAAGGPLSAGFLAIILAVVLRMMRNEPVDDTGPQTFDSQSRARSRIGDTQSRVSSRERRPDRAGRRLLPLPAPRWLFLLFPVGMACALAAVWSPARHYLSPASTRLVLWASPAPIGALTLVGGGAFTALPGLYYSAGGRFGAWAVPVILSVVVGTVGLARAWTTGPENRGRGRPRARSAAQNG